MHFLHRKGPTIYLFIYFDLWPCGNGHFSNRHQAMFVTITPLSLKLTHKVSKKKRPWMINNSSICKCYQGGSSSPQHPREPLSPKKKKRKKDWRAPKQDQYPFWTTPNHLCSAAIFFLHYLLLPPRWDHHHLTHCYTLTFLYFLGLNKLQMNL